MPSLQDLIPLKISQYNVEHDRGNPQDSFISTEMDTAQLKGNVIDVERVLNQSTNSDETVSLGKSMPNTKNIVSKAWGVDTNKTSIKLDRKRKNPESAIPSPNTWKRQRRQRQPLGLDFSQGTADMPDPSIMARKHREEFLASRKNSLSESYDSPSCMSSVNGTPHRKLDLRVNPIPSLTSKDQPDSDSESTVVQEFQHLPKQQNAKTLLSAHEEHIVAADTTAEALEGLRSEKMETNLDAVSQKLKVVSSAQVSQNSTKAIDEPIFSGVQAQSLPELMTPALSITDGEPVQSFEPFAGMQPRRSSLPPTGIFENFRITYPEYTGTIRHFVGICKKIRSLHDADQMEHKALWDDFIIRHNTEYPQYLGRCAEAVEDSLPYEKYYRSEIEEPIHRKHIVTPKSLSQVLGSESSPYTSGSLTRSETPLHSKADSVPPSQQEAKQVEVRTKKTALQQQREESPNAVFQRLEKRRQRRLHLSSPTVGRASTAFSQKQAAPPPPEESHLKAKNEQAAETIDLTGDEVMVPESPPCGTFGSPTLSPKKSSRTLPWVASSDTLTPTRRDLLSRIDSVIAPKIRHGEHNGPVSSFRATNSAPSKLSKISSKPGMRDTSLPRTSSFCRSKRAIESSSKKPFEVQKSMPNIEMQSAEPRGTDDWWKDENSPFNKFRRKYMAITPGKGNSYAQDREREIRKETENN